METMRQIISVLQIVIRVGVAARVVICLLKISVNNDENGVAENKARIKNAIIFAVLNETVWVIQSIVFSYYSVGLDI